MKKKLFEDWLSALESGKYKQGKGLLRNNLTDEYCCLGVLCEVAGIEIKPKYSALPVEFAEAVGMKTYGDPLGGRHTSLARINDDGTPFIKIAAILRRNHSIYIKEIE